MRDLYKLGVKIKEKRKREKMFCFSSIRSNEEISFYCNRKRKEIRKRNDKRDREQRKGEKRRKNERDVREDRWDRQTKTIAEIEQKKKRKR